ncbi:MAG: 50S ribosomal protein L3 [Phycisphaerae bacterium]|nr:50S ribosomal protein L3 [Phycisphaerae bacterium]
MAANILGRKVGMTRIFTEDGVNVPVTVVSVGPCHVSQIKTPKNDGYAAIQMAFDEIKPRRSSNPVIGHDAKAGLGPRRTHREFRVGESELEGFELGQEVNLDQFDSVKYVDVTGTSKGGGFTGSVKRWGFKGQLASHGVKRRHRSPGSIGGHANNAGKSGGIRKGKRMAGHDGHSRVTARSLDVLGLDKERGLMLVKGPVPGARNGLLMITEAKRLYKRKARNAKTS